MIKGTKNWADRGTFSVQTNNAIETILHKKLPVGADGIPHGWLEDCGPTAAINILDAMGHPTETKSPAGWAPQPEDVLACWFNDPRNYGAMVRPGVDPAKFLGNEIPQWYPAALAAVFGVSARYLEGQTFDWMATIVQGGAGAMICLKDPGHFLAVVAYDDETKELIYRDSWPGRTKTDGFNLRMGRAEWSANVNPFLILIS